MMPRGWVLFMVSTLMLSATGAGYAAWTQALHVEGEVRTGNVDANWISQEITVEEGIGTIHPQTGEIVLKKIPPPVDDVADCTIEPLSGTTAKTVRFNIVNAFPNFACKITVGARVAGTLPVRITASETFATNSSGNNVLGTELDVQAKLTEKLANEQSQGKLKCKLNSILDTNSALNVGDGFCLVITLRLRPDGNMNQVYAAGARIEVTQWNLSGEN